MYQEKLNIRGCFIGVTKECEVISGNDNGIQVTNRFNSREAAWDYVDLLEDFNKVLDELQECYKKGQVCFLDQDDKIIEPDEIGYTVNGESLVPGLTDGQEKRLLSTIVYAGCGECLEPLFFSMTFPKFDYMKIDITTRHKGVLRTGSWPSNNILEWVSDEDEMINQFLR